MSKWECAESSPDTDNLIALAQLYGVSVDELLFANPEDFGEDAARSNEKPLEDDVEYSAEFEIDDESSNTEESSAEDYVDISLENGVHVRDTKKGEEVHVGWDGIHIDSGNEHVHIDFGNFKSIALAIREMRKSQS